MSTETKNKMNPAQKATKGSNRGIFNGPNDPLSLLQKGGGTIEQGVSSAEEIMVNQKRWLIEIQHLATRESVVFKSFLTEFTDAFNCSWESEEIFGRMDPIQIFKNTKRQITIGWDIPANDINEARYNMIKVNTLMKMLYPVYGDVRYQSIPSPTPTTTREIKTAINDLKKSSKGKAGQQAATRKFIQDITKIGVNTTNFGSQSTYMVAAPLLKMKFTNLISHPGKKVVADVDSAGLVGTTDGFVFEPDLEAGFFDPGPSMLFPKLIRLSCNFTVLHTHKLGYPENKTKSVFFYDNNPERFPYAITDAPPPGRKPSSFYIAQERARLKREAEKLAAADEAARKKRLAAQAKAQADLKKKLDALAKKEEAERKKAAAAARKKAAAERRRKRTQPRAPAPNKSKISQLQQTPETRLLQLGKKIAPLPKKGDKDDPIGANQRDIDQGLSFLKNYKKNAGTFSFTKEGLKGAAKGASIATAQLARASYLAVGTKVGKIYANVALSYAGKNKQGKLNRLLDASIIAGEKVGKVVDKAATSVAGNIAARFGGDMTYDERKKDNQRRAKQFERDRLQGLKKQKLNQERVADFKKQNPSFKKLGYFQVLRILDRQRQLNQQQLNQQLRSMQQTQTPAEKIVQQQRQQRQQEAKRRREQQVRAERLRKLREKAQSQSSTTPKRYGQSSGPRGAKN